MALECGVPVALAGVAGCEDYPGIGPPRQTLEPLGLGRARLVARSLLGINMG
eukprot:CAMPEP_0180206282 /NCGR_PEP_ID=MMETSP0987-20121128/9462_1 /TAXON_ID=697907 /ORGANISM="non described non described, Strain CCMP2293" /LENGTH=51 /DNA_ID=CAMNT_0022162029 /DNA_START=265 /DNA_END=416 /DNA_ORIENTATION=+